MSLRKSSQKLVRLQKLIAHAGKASRREAEEWIKAGRVTINGQIADIGTKADPRVDRICIDGKILEISSPLMYYRIYKPIGYLTTMRDDRGRSVIADLITDLPHRVYPVGRLDYNSEGVVLLTNDGKLAHALAHPSYQIPRTYHVKLRGSPSNAKLQQLLKGVMLEDGLAQALHVERINSTPAGHLWLEIVLTEGRNREIRRMCEAIGHSVTRLVRKRFANIHVDDLRPGEYQILTQDDIQTLYELIGSSNK